jgi:isopenicillin N synthase-like dioxygenase
VNLHGEWQDVVAPEDTLVINVGEVLKFLSGGVVKYAVALRLVCTAV